MADTPLEIANQAAGESTTARKTQDTLAEHALSPSIEMMATAHLKTSRRTARTHAKKQIQRLAESIKAFGLFTPVIVDQADEVVAGFARLAAAKMLQLNKIPVIRASHLDDTKLRAYMLADNKIAEKSGWDRDVLRIELGELQVKLPEIGFDLALTGFDDAEVDDLLFDYENEGRTAEDVLPNTPIKPVARLGDCFTLGPHRLVVGDARDTNAFRTLMQEQVAQMAFLDPPYNVPIKGHVGGRGKIKHDEFVCASGEMNKAQFTDFLTNSLVQCAAYTADGGITYICMDWRHIEELSKAGTAAYDELKNVCVWTKTSPGQGTFYRNTHEFIFVYKRGTSSHINTFELGQHGRTRTNVWSYPGANSFRAGRMDELTMHPTVKPVQLVADTIRDCSRRGSIVLDAFCGSGTTFIAAEQTGRRAFCLELDPRYADVSIRRWQKFTGRDATLEPTGQTFAELENSRCSPNSGHAHSHQEAKAQ